MEMKINTIDEDTGYNPTSGVVDDSSGFHMDKHKRAHKLLLERFDLNGDGKIDAEEYKIMLERFAQVDTNADGMISEFEVQQFMANNPDEEEKFIRELIEINMATEISIDSRRDVANFAHKYGNMSNATVATNDRLNPIITPLEAYFDDIADVFPRIAPVQASEDDYIDDYARYSLWIMALGIFLGLFPISVPIWLISCCIRPVNDGLVGLMGLTLGSMIGPAIMWLSGDAIIRVKKRLTPFYEVDVIKSCCCLRPIDVWNRAWELYGIVYLFQPAGDIMNFGVCRLFSEILADYCRCGSYCSCCEFMRPSENQISFTDLDGPIQGRPLDPAENGKDHPLFLHGKKKAISTPGSMAGDKAAITMAVDTTDTKEDEDEGEGMGI